MTKKSVVFVGFLPGFGGAEKAMIMVANGLARLGNEITIISFKDNNVVYKMENKIKYIHIPDIEGKKYRVLFKRFTAFKRVIKEIKPDVVISFWLQPAIFSSIISKKIGFRTIYSERGDPTDKEYTGFLGLLRKVFLKSIDGFVFQTEGAKRCFPKSIQDRSVVIHNPVPIKYNDYELPKVRNKVIVNVGRLHEQKNQKLLINAFSKINNTYPDYTLEIYGDGELKQQLKTHIKKLGLQEKVFLMGTTQKIFDKIVNASIFVLSSDYEGMPNALMEAMALGIPSISTDCKPGGARELIENQQNGLLVKRDSVEELASAIQYMIENKNKAHKMGRKSKKICNTNSIDIIINKWNSYITQL